MGIITLAMDVTDQQSIDRAVATIQQASEGQVHVLVNNAAIFNLMPLADVDISDGQRLFDVNFFGALRVIQSFLPLLIAANGTAIVANVSSISAIMHPVWQGMYASSKAALLAMGNIMRVELAPLGIRVVTIMSGGVDTAGIRASSRQGQALPEGSFYKPLATSIETNAQGRSMRATDPRDYAQQVVSDILQANPPPLLWRGSFAFIGWITTWLGWTGMMDKDHTTRAGLDSLAKR
jgi:1-acylglycerone phosphate reductase